MGWFGRGRSDEGLEPDVDPYAEHHHGHHTSRQEGK
jgi:hypothetical protein